MIALLVAAALAGDGEPTGAIELAGAYSPFRGPGGALGVRMGIPVEVTRRDLMWQAYPELAFRYTILTPASRTGFGNLSAAAGGRVSAVVWKDDPRRKKRFKGREKWREYVEVGVSGHVGIGFDTQNTDPSLDADGLFDPRPYGDLGVYATYHDTKLGYGVHLVQSVLLPAGWELERTPITVLGVHVEMSLDDALGLMM